MTRRAKAPENPAAARTRDDTPTTGDARRKRRGNRNPTPPTPHPDPGRPRLHPDQSPQLTERAVAINNHSERIRLSINRRMSNNLQRNLRQNRYRFCVWRREEILFGRNQQNAARACTSSLSHKTPSTRGCGGAWEGAGEGGGSNRTIVHRSTLGGEAHIVVTLDRHSAAVLLNVRRLRHLPRWRNWQTHYLEVVAPERAWRFKSSPGHCRGRSGSASTRVHGTGRLMKRSAMIRSADCAHRRRANGRVNLKRIISLLQRSSTPAHLA